MTWRLSSGQQAALWWLALGCMVVDHVAAIYAPGVTEFRVPGRLTYPIFAFLVAYNVHARGVAPSKYLDRLVPFAVLSQLPYMIAFGNGHINILGTLAVGVLAMLGPVAWIGAVLLAMVLQLAGLPLEYGLAGVLLPWVVGIFLQETGPRRVGALACVLLVVWLLNPGSLALSAAAVAGVGMIAFSHLLPELPRAPRFFGYGFYPGHLSILAALVLLL